jgi:type IV secretory pathway VirB2 component (pilin)
MEQAAIQQTHKNSMSLMKALLVTLTIMAIPELAFAQGGPGTGFLRQIYTWMQDWGLYLCYVGFGITGILFWFNVIDLKRLGWACVGVVVFFGTPQIVTWVRGAIS